MRVVIDRIEDGIATVELENGKLLNVPSELFCGCKEGDMVDIVANKSKTYLKKKQLAQFDDIEEW